LVWFTTIYGYASIFEKPIRKKHVAAFPLGLQGAVDGEPWTLLITQPQIPRFMQE
jgi:hypothetical protein